MNNWLVVLRKNIGVSIIAILALMLLSSAPISAQDVAKPKSGQMALSHVLDGKTFLTLEEKPDELIFKDGTFFSTGCAEWGFEASPVMAMADGDAIHFTTESLSPEHGKMVWQGTIEGETMKASYEWTKERWYWKDAHKVKEFQATLKR